MFWQGIVISYIIKALCSGIHEVIFKDITFSWAVRVLLLVSVSVLLSIITIVIFETKFVKKWFKKINHKTTHDNIWLDIVDYTGTSVHCVCNDNTSYYGVLTMHEENGTDSWFVLEDYIVEEEGEKYYSEEMSFPSKLALNLKNVKRIELYYGNNG